MCAETDVVNFLVAVQLFGSSIGSSSGDMIYLMLTFRCEFVRLIHQTIYRYALGFALGFLE